MELEEKYSESSRNIKKAIELSENYIADTAQNIRNNAVSWTEIEMFIKNYHHYLFFLEQLKEIISINNNEIVSKVDTYFAEKDLANRDNVNGDYLDVLMWDGWNSLFSKSIKPLLDVKATHNQVVAQNTALKDENQNLKAEASKLKAENTALNAENQNLNGEAAKLKAENDTLKTENQNLKDEAGNSTDNWNDEVFSGLNRWILTNAYYINHQVKSSGIINKLKDEKYEKSSKNIIKTIKLLESYIVAKMTIARDKENVSWGAINYLISSYYRYEIFLDQLNEIINIDNNELVSKVNAFFEEKSIDTKDNLDDSDLSYIWYEWHSLFTKSIKPLLDVKATHNQVVAQNTALKDENQNLKAEASKLKAENTALKAQNQNLKDAAAKLKAENDALKTENNQSKNDKENLQNQFGELTKKHNKLLANNKKDKNKIFIFIVLLLSINIILWAIIALIIFKKSYKSKSSI
ncbi:SH3 domain protein [Mycoplasmopsis bovigenitalium]|uniref:SH3 domain protein n=1 Tax=Mycoplasmopsis bovigenitalium TaxID=2112 RepID=A0A449A940_9BACT|nr:hypothetical protein [Mycoplasmopsis bovigenitalium]VEU60696.1 SH3 domain protein [Mycoplasmopsis bovigenitalium]